MAVFKKGYLRAGKIRGARLWLHWSLPLGALVLGRFEFVPVFWLAFMFLIVIHEFGHAACVWYYRQKVTLVELHGLGGACHWDGYVTPLQRSVIAWGGIMGQMVALIVWLIVRLAAGPPTTDWGYQLSYAFFEGNLFLMAFNLIPIRPLDGAEAWKSLGLLKERGAARRRRRAARADSSARREVQDLERFERMRSLDVLDEVDAQLEQLTRKAGKKFESEQRGRGRVPPDDPERGEDDLRDPR